MPVCMHACMSICMYVCIQANSHIDAFRYIYIYVCPSIYRSIFQNKGAQKGSRSSGETPSGACGHIRRINGGQCSVVLCALGVWGVSVDGSILSGTSQGTHRRIHLVLTGQSTGRASVGACARCGRDVQQHPAAHGTTACLVCDGISRRSTRVLIYTYMYMFT